LLDRSKTYTLAPTISGEHEAGMFERYTERARRAVFFARYEASQHGSANIEPEHILLGLLRENFLLFGNRLHPSIAHVSRIRQEIEKRIEKKPIYSTAVEIPLSAIGKRVLILAAEEAERLKHSYIGTEHMLLGLLRIEHSAPAKVLRDNGILLEDIRTKVSDIAGVQSARVSFAEGPDAAVNQFLSALKRHDRAELVEFFLPIAQFVDTSGKRWAGRAEIDAGLQELLAPYAKRNSMYLVEEPFIFARDVCLAFVLWENVVRTEEAAKPILRMALCLVQSGPDWKIVFVQVTPVAAGL